MIQRKQATMRYACALSALVAATIWSCPPAIAQDGTALPAELRDARISVAAMAADVRSVLLTIGEQVDLQVVIDPDVHGAITVEIEEMPLEDALEAVIGPTRYHYGIERGVLRVFGEEVQTRLFALDYITGVRTGLTQLSASSGSSGAAGSSNASSTSSGSGQSDVAQSSSRVNSQSYTDPWAEIIRGLEMIVYGTTGELAGSSHEGPERLVVHPATGVILVTASYEILNRVAHFLESIAGNAQRQVVIEARVVEVSLLDEFHMGIDWSLIPDATDVTGVFGRDKAAAAQALSPGLGAFQIAGSTGDFDALLDALATQGRLKVVSAPRVATLNNQKAIIKVARESSFFNLRVEYEYQPDGSRIPISSVDPQRITIGLILDVTPQISPEGRIMMHVHPSLTELVDTVVFPPDATGADVQANAPVLDIREVDTVVRVADGDMLIIGGLTKERVERRTRGVPLLSKIPLLGWLFRTTHDVTEQVELLILMKPTVVIGRDANESAVRELERLGQK